MGREPNDDFIQAVREDRALELAEANGYQRGRADVLARVRALPSPLIVLPTRLLHGGLVNMRHCLWCGLAFHQYDDHPKNSPCLWAEAHASEEPRPGAAARTTQEGE